MSQHQTPPNAAAPAQRSNNDISTAYQRVLETIFSHEHVFYSPPTSPHKLLISQKTQPSVPTISSLSLHPVIESILHILNCDLPSAHFLCRHAEVSPKWESMFVHGILHRIEGDIDNTRAWYGDVKETEMFQHVWSEQREDGGEDPAIVKQGWEHFLDRVERYRDRTRKRSGKGGWEGDGDVLDLGRVKDWKEEERLLREASLWELKQVLRFCETKFGIGEVEDARKEFLGRVESGNTEQMEMAQNMVTGGEGWRTF